MELVESGRSFAKMEERKRKRREGEAGKIKDGSGSGSGSVATGGGGSKAPRNGEEVQGETSRPGVGDAHRRIRRRFKQSSPVADVGGGGAGGMDAAVLRSVFGKKKGRV